MTAKASCASVTYGAGGGAREKTIEIVEQIQRQFSLTTMAHLLHQAHAAEINAILDEANNRGIRNILALRGDPERESQTGASGLPPSW